MESKDQNFIVNPDGEPNWWLRRGQVFVLVVFLIAIVAACLFSFNEVIQGEVRVISKYPPAQVSAKRPGKLMAINFQPGDSVSEGAVLGILENSASAEDISYLKVQLQKTLIKTSIDTLKMLFPNELRLGNAIQTSYKSFLDAYREVLLENLLKEDVVTQLQLNEKLEFQNRIAKNKEQELFLAERAYQLQEKNLERQKKLFQKGIISVYDLEKIENEYLIAKQKVQIITQQIETIKIEKNDINTDKTSAENLQIKNSSLREGELKSAQQALFNDILEWEEDNLLVSPIAGELSINNVWGKYQNVAEGELVFVVVPFAKDSLIGRCKVPIKNSGKIKKGQVAFLKLDNYPFREWGILKAQVQSISEIPGTGNVDYVVFLKINNLITSYGRELKYTKELFGNAEILLEETSIMERIFYQFRHLWSQKI